MIRINMRSSAKKVKGQGVASCYMEQVNLVKNNLSEEFEVTENKSGKFDIVHYHTVNPDYYLERLLNRRNTIGVGYVHFLPSTLEDSLRLPWLFKKVFYKYVLSFYNNMDYLVTVNPFFIQKIEESGIKKPKVTCIPNFVSSKVFCPMPEEERINAREKHGFDKDSFLVLGVGQLQTRKGVLDFVETARRLPDIQFIWAGGFSFGKLSDGYDEIRKIVESPPENVRFLGIIPREEMPEIYNISDVFFIPSYEELFPMAILEAMGCKKAVIHRDVPLYETILPGACLKGKNVEDFAKHISNLAQNSGELLKWSEKSWQCHMNYSEEKMAEQWRAFYKNAYKEKQEDKNQEQL